MNNKQEINHLLWLVSKQSDLYTQFQLKQCNQYLSTHINIPNWNIKESNIFSDYLKISSKNPID